MDLADTEEEQEPLLAVLQRLKQRLLRSITAFANGSCTQAAGLLLFLPLPHSLSRLSMSCL